MDPPTPSARAAGGSAGSEDHAVTLTLWILVIVVAGGVFLIALVTLLVYYCCFHRPRARAARDTNSQANSRCQSPSPGPNSTRSTAGSSECRGERRHSTPSRVCRGTVVAPVGGVKVEEADTVLARASPAANPLTTRPAQGNAAGVQQGRCTAPHIRGERPPAVRRIAALARPRGSGPVRVASTELLDRSAPYLSVVGLTRPRPAYSLYSIPSLRVSQVSQLDQMSQSNEELRRQESILSHRSRGFSQDEAERLHRLRHRESSDRDFGEFLDDDDEGVM